MAAEFVKYLPYIIELRKRVIRASLIILITFLALFYYNKELFTYLVTPLVDKIQITLIATSIISTFTVPTKLSFLVTLILLIPYLVIELWAFLLPALYANERRYLAYGSLVSISLFYLGLAFAYYVLIPLSLNFFTLQTPTNVQFMPDIQHMLQYSSHLLAVTGLVFEIPVIIFLALRFNLVTVATLSYIRPYAVVLIFTLGMLLTPPDVLSQILLSIPMLILYELGIICYKLFPAKNN